MTSHIHSVITFTCKGHWKLEVRKKFKEEISNLGLGGELEEWGGMGKMAKAGGALAKGRLRARRLCPGMYGKLIEHSFINLQSH